jgi:HEAT repeat protein
MTKPATIALIAKFNVDGERIPILVARRIAKTGKTALPEIISALKNSPNARIRRWSAYTMRLLPDKRSLLPLKIALKDENMSVRLLAMESLELIHARVAGRYILPLLSDESGGVRVRALGCLIRLRYRPALKKFKVLMRDEKDYVRKAASEGVKLMNIPRKK